MTIIPVQLYMVSRGGLKLVLLDQNFALNSDAAQKKKKKKKKKYILNFDNSNIDDAFSLDVFKPGFKHVFESLQNSISSRKQIFREIYDFIMKFYVVCTR